MYFKIWNQWYHFGSRKPKPVTDPMPFIFTVNLLSALARMQSTEGFLVRKILEWYQFGDSFGVSWFSKHRTHIWGTSNLLRLKLLAYPEPSSYYEVRRLTPQALWQLVCEKAQWISGLKSSSQFYKEKISLNVLSYCKLQMIFHPYTDVSKVAFFLNL